MTQTQGSLTEGLLTIRWRMRTHDILEIEHKNYRDSIRGPRIIDLCIKGFSNDELKKKLSDICDTHNNLNLFEFRSLYYQLYQVLVKELHLNNMYNSQYQTYPIYGKDVSNGLSPNPGIYGGPTPYGGITGISNSPGITGTINAMTGITESKQTNKKLLLLK